MNSVPWTRAAPSVTLPVLLLWAGSLAGQTELEVTPKAGWLHPVGGFTEAAVLDAEHFISFHELDGMPLVGADLTFRTGPGSL